MTWLQRYQLKRTFRRSLWLLPMSAILLVLVVAPLIRLLDRFVGWNWFNFTPEGAHTILSAFSASMLTFLVFVVSSLLIVVQLASAQLTPRIIAMVFSDWPLKWVLCTFTFSFTYTIAVSGRIEETVPQLSVAIVIVCNLACIVIFLWFVQWIGGSLRPIAVLHKVAEEGRAVIESVYPEPFDPAEKQPGWSPAPKGEVYVVEHIGISGVMLAFDRGSLAEMAELADVVIELAPQVGDFVARGEPLFRIYGSGRAVDAGVLRASVAIGPERTMEQDPRFAFRIMVDIANKALSPAINDPTTAVLALDQIHRLLMYVGERRLDAGRIRDTHDRLRLFYGTPDWPDFVCLAVTEIRHYGAASIQVARRLQAMLKRLLSVMPEARKAVLEQELNLLQHAIQRSFPDKDDFARAQVGDYQGIGSSESS
jgi:uncharacterized membrane protein